jgi:4-hydroxymandelate oxidase
MTLTDLEDLARSKLPKSVYDYYAGGAHDEVTLRENTAAWARLKLHYRVLVDVSQRSTATTVLGQPVSMPVLVAPTAFHRLATPEGELATVRAAGKAGTVMILSSLSNTPVEEVVKASTGPVWFQLYVYKDRAATLDLLARVEAAGCKALVLTVDMPMAGLRERDVKNRFVLPETLEVANMSAAGYGTMTPTVGSGFAAYIAERLDPALSWKDVAWLESKTRLPLLVKGLIRADDARHAANAGAKGIVVSNHGGRQLDGSPATSEVLPRITQALGGDCEVLVDGGVRRGTDVLKALAYGAKAVLLGRPILWGLAAEGEEGVTRVLEMFRSEVDLAMALAGCASVGEVTRDLVEP